MLKRVLAWSLVIPLVGAALPAPILAGPARQQTGQVSGLTRDEANHPNARYALRLRNLDTNETANDRSTDGGTFSFKGIGLGRYIVEVLDGTGRVLGTSSTVIVTQAVSTVTDVLVITPTNERVGGAFFDSSAGLLLSAALGAGVTTGVAASKPGSSPR